MLLVDTTSWITAVKPKNPTTIIKCSQLAEGHLFWPYPHKWFTLSCFLQSVSLFKKKCNSCCWLDFFLDSFSSPADLQEGRGPRLARLQPLLGRWAAASPARRHRPPWLLRSSPPSTPLETLQLPSPARSVCVWIRSSIHPALDRSDVFYCLSIHFSFLWMLIDPLWRKLLWQHLVHNKYLCEWAKPA